MIKNSITATAFALSIYLLSACNDNNTTTGTPSDSAQHNKETAGTHENHGAAGSAHGQLMQKMMDDMNAVKMTGDFDLDFANMMIPHHQSAVDMAQDYLPKGKDEKIKGMAQKIIEAQRKEIEQLRTMASNHKPAEKKDEHAAGGHAGGAHSELMDAMNKMMDKMKGIPMTGNADRDFVAMMIPHHQSAVDMAENEISHGRNIEMKRFAQQVIDDQSREINEFQTWLTRNK
jgi:uncharacterized protein (DUF305 family)